MKMDEANKYVFWLPAAFAAASLAALALWLLPRADARLTLRIPGTDVAPGMEALASGNPVQAGKLTKGDGQPAADLPGAWPCFRGPNRDGISVESKLARLWSGAPRELWAVDVGEGYASPAVLNGRAYVMDYDAAQKQDALRCLSLADGKEIWRFAYPLRVKRNHGMSRTMPAVTEKFVVAMGPKCHVVCLDAVTGEMRWNLDLVNQFDAAVPEWYAGQCVLIEKDAVILAPGGKDALLLAVDLATGKELWRSPNPRKWKMTHSSVTPMEVAGKRMYVYCASGGVVGVSAKDGAILWETPDWRISIANVPSPVVLEDGRVFLSGGYDAGSMMIQLQPEGEKFAVKKLFKLDPKDFGATQQTPIYFGGHIYGVRPDGQFVCLDTDGKTRWASGSGQQFGLGAYTMAGGLIFAINDNGKLSLIEATPARFNLLAQAQVLKGRESWGPLTLAGGRLIARDLTKMVCLDVGAK